MANDGSHESSQIGGTAAKTRLKYFDIIDAKQAYIEGKNVTELLRNQKGVSFNTSDIIEMAYDLQAGTYIESVRNNIAQASLYASELALMLDEHTPQASSLLDVGTGEITTFSLVSKKLENKPKNLLAFDLSWSRIYKGIGFAKEVMKDDLERLIPFVADINEIPLRDKSVDITTSSHALEPNGKTLKVLMSELFRITRGKIVLFEPCYEINSAEGKKRMESLGYIKNIEGVVAELGGRVISRTPIKNISNPLNPTACYVIMPPKHQNGGGTNEGPMNEFFSVPGTQIPLSKNGDFYFSNVTGHCYPILKGIPILKSNTAILASCFED